MRVLLAVFGTRGDVQPMLALAVALKAKGHTPILVGPPNFAREAAHFGIAYQAFGCDSRVLLDENRGALDGGGVRMVRFLRDSIGGELGMQFACVKEAAKGADLVLAAGMMFAAASVADAMKIPYRYVAYTPDAIASRFHAPVTCPARDLPPSLNRAAWWVSSAVQNWVMKERINAERADLGLAAVDDLQSYLFAVERVLLAADPALASWPRDLASASPPTGAWLLPDRRELGAKLEAFLEDGERPVYIGFGSMVDEDPARTTALIADAVQRLGCRAILGSGWAKLGGTDYGPRILTIDEVPHAALFPRVSVVVHHGGAGTTHAAMRAGVPQVVVPHILDQFGWAHRVHELGLSPRPVKRSVLNANHLVASIRACLADTGMHARAARLRDAARAQDGTATAIAIIERIATGPRPSKRPPPSLRLVRTGDIAA